MKCTFILIFLIFNAPVLAATSGTKIYFGNGMFNTADEVKYSLDHLKQLNLSQIESLPNHIEYDQALNLSETALDNVLTVIEQKGITDTSYFWDVLSGLIPMPDWLSKTIASAILSPLESDTENQMMISYQAALAAKKRILLVSHSQGNFYAETIYKRMFKSGLYSAKFFGNVRVATPTQTLTDFPYFTFSDDFFMNLVRAAAGAPPANLPAIGSGLGPVRDPYGHQFVNAYLNTPQSAEAIRQAIIDQVRKTSYPN